MTTRFAVFGVPILVLGLLVTASSPARASLPGGTTPVAVTGGSFALLTDAHLHSAGSITGTVTGPGGAGIVASVQVWRAGNVVATAVTDASGFYEANGLRAGTFAVCVPGTGVVTSTATGLLGRCHGGAAYDGGAVPISAFTVSVSVGVQVNGVDVALRKAAAISGKVTAPSGAGISSVGVLAHNRSTGKNYLAFTNGTGAYKVLGLTASPNGYTVCFNPFIFGTGPGFRPACFRNQPWSGARLPSGTRSVAVSLGHVHTGVNQTLSRGGAISGTVRSRSGTPLAHVTVVVFAASGKALAATVTNVHGHYVVRGLAAATGDRACAAGFDASPAVSYHGVCWKTTAWAGHALPSGTDPIAVHLGATHSGINFALPRTVYPLGLIKGTIHETVDNGTLEAADVYLYSNSGVQLRHTSSDSSGHYSFSHLRASAAGYVICVRGDLALGAPATGWDARCHADTLWNGLTVPRAATRVPLSPGQNRTGIDVSLRPAGGITGHIYLGDDNSTLLLESVEVVAFTPGGREVTETFSDDQTGQYQLVGLNPGNYVVCFDGRFATNTSPIGLVPQCFDRVAWDGPG